MKPGYIFEPPTSNDEKEELAKLYDSLTGIENFCIMSVDKSIEIPPFITIALKEIIKTLYKGESITMIPMDKELTTQQAADILNVSRPFFVKLLTDNEIPYRKVGTHRKVSMKDLINYKNKQTDRRKEYLNKMTELSQEMGLYD